MIPKQYLYFPPKYCWYNYSPHNFYCCKSCNNVKVKLSCLVKYNVDNCMKSKIVQDKTKSTCLERYNVEYITQYKNVIEKSRNTKLTNNRTLYDIDKLINYRKRVIGLTAKNKNNLFKNWNGYDYYDNEYIIEYRQLKYSDSNYPTVDHKISIYYGFINNIEPEIIANINNLCITKNKINIQKSKKTEEEFLLFLENIKNQGLS